MHAHYKEFPKHKKGIKNNKANGHAPEPVAVARHAERNDPRFSKVFQEVSALEAKFERQIADSESAVAGIKIALDEHEAELTRLRAGLAVLRSINEATRLTTPTDEEHQQVAS